MMLRVTTVGLPHESTRRFLRPCAVTRLHDAALPLVIVPTFIYGSAFGMRGEMGLPMMSHFTMDQPPYTNYGDDL